MVTPPMTPTEEVRILKARVGGKLPPLLPPDAPDSPSPAPSPVSAATEAHDGTTEAQEARE